jgi:hypothetical protein
VQEPGINPEDREQRVTIKMERQNLLRRRLPEAPSFDVIINEAVLRRPLRPRQAMGDQLAHLRSVSAELPNVTIRVLPLSAGIHIASSAGAFAILGFPDGGANPEPPTVYSEGPTGALYLDKPSELTAYETIWSGLNNVVLGHEESDRLLQNLVEEYQR